MLFSCISTCLVYITLSRVQYKLLFIFIKNAKWNGYDSNYMSVCLCDFGRITVVFGGSYCTILSISIIAQWLMYIATDSRLKGTGIETGAAV